MSLLVKGARRAGGFGVSVVITGVTNIATVPFVIAHTGADGWASIAVGQSLGSIVGIFTLLGWIQTGPTAVARLSGAGRGKYFSESVFIRSTSLLITVPVCAVVAILLQTGSPLATFVSAVGMLFINLGASWFYIGEGNARGLLCFDAIPRALGIIAATVAVTLGAGVVAYASLVLVGALVAAVAAAGEIWVRYGAGGFRWMGPTAIAATLFGQRHGISTALLSSAYLSAPILILQTLVPAGVPSFALADKIKQQALTAYRPVSQALQGWTPKASEGLVQQRVHKVFRVTIALGVCGACVFAAGFPLVTHVLGAGKVSVSWNLGLPMALAFGMNIWSLTLGVACLLPLGLEKHITISAAIGLLVTAVLIVPLTLNFSAMGTASAVAMGQTSVAVYQVFVLRKKLSRRTVHDVVTQ